MLDFNFSDWIRVFSEFRNLERAQLWLSKINSSTICTMWRTAITVNYLQMLCLLVVLFFLLWRVALVVGVLLSLKSCFSCWGTAFFEEFTLFGGVLACFLRRAALRAVLSDFGFFEGLLYLWGRLACGVAWLVERWSFVSCFSVSINKLKIYE